MAQTGYTPISLYYSTTAAATPSAVNLANGELAINITDGKLYYKDNGGTVQLIASKAGASGDVVGPASATDNAVVRFDGTTGKLVQNSVVTIADSTGDISGVGSITSTSASGILTRAAATQDGVELIGRAGGSSSYKVTLTPTTLGGNRTLTLPDTTGTVALTGSTVASFSAGSTGFTPNTATTGAVTLAGTLATTNGGTGLTSFTANGVVYASSSSALATGSALTFDSSANFSFTGTGLYPVISVAPTGNNAIFGFRMDASAGNGVDWRVEQGRSAVGDFNISAPGVNATPQYTILKNLSAHYWSIGSSEQMRLTSTGLGIGTSSPSEKLEVVGVAKIRTSGGSGIQIVSSSTPYIQAFGASGNNILQFNGQSISFWSGASYGAESEKMRLDSSGNLGLGVTPSAWTLSQAKAIQVSPYGSLSSYNNGSTPITDLGNNIYGGFSYLTTGAASFFRQNGGEFQWFTAPSGTAGNAITFSQVMTLDASGNLGIGTSSPINNGGYGGLSLNGTSGALFSMLTNGTESSRIASIGDQTSIQCKATTGYITFVQGVSGGTERARIDSSGNLLVGTTSTNARLRVVSTAGQSNGLYVTHPTAAQDVISCENSDTSGNNTLINFYTDATVSRGTIVYNRTSGLVVYGTSSDYRAKDINGPMTDSGALIDSVPVYIGTMKGATQKRPMFIAHETPEYAHIGEKDAVDANGKPIYQQVDVSALVPVMWAEIQSLRQRVAQLEGA